jgi:succinyl-diaminopimelate desuccinylase
VVMTADPVAIARDLLRCRSITPAEGGALTFLEATLKAAGLTVYRMTFKEPRADDVENLYARIGMASPHLMFAGHTDVVPPGDETAWKHPPFAGEMDGAELYGRGAVDMKGGIACAVAAVLDHLTASGGKPRGSISFLITGDEEGIAVNGTPKLLAWAADRGEKFDHCLLGEPSNVNELGDTIKIGRRGSLNGQVIVTGRLGHVAYPQRAENPIRGLVALVAALQSEPLDEGTAQFSPSHLEFVSVDVGNKTVNLIPGEARARFNIRFNDTHTLGSLKKLIEQRAAKAAQDLAASGKIKFAFEWAPSNAGVFVTKPGPFMDMVIGAIEKAIGRKPELSTSGGTSDARFITQYCPVVEFGLVGQTMHAVDERVPVADLQALTAIYRTIIDRYFG